MSPNVCILSGEHVRSRGHGRRRRRRSVVPRAAPIKWCSLQTLLPEINMLRVKNAWPGGSCTIGGRDHVLWLNQEVLLLPLPRENVVADNTFADLVPCRLMLPR